MKHLPTPQWTSADYQELLEELLERRTALDLEAYFKRECGVWLRHDVELDLEAAVEIAKLESKLHVRSTYFVCPESPFIRDRPSSAVSSAIAELRHLGHDVGCHLVLRAGLPTPWERLESILETYREMNVQDHVTFHAPGVGADVLALLPFGEAVYTGLANQSAVYFSDSTGRWRWGLPTDEDVPIAPMQLLTHPYWWAGSVAALRAELSPEQTRTFLPQFSYQLATSRDTV